MNMLKEVNLYKLSKTISKKFQIKEQKSYEAVALRLGLIFNHLVVSHKKT